MHIDDRALLDARTSHTRERLRATAPLLLVAGVLGLLLGLLAAAADRFGGGTGIAVIAVVSTALSWGAAAAFLGSLVRNVAAAAAVATTLLVVAVLVYYRSAVAGGMRSGGDDVAHATLVWGAAAVAAGLMLGPAGWLVRSGTVVHRALAAGVMGGLLASQGTYLGWRIRDLGAEGLPVLVLALFLVGVPALAALWLAPGRRLIALGVLAGVAVAGAVAWSVVLDQIR